MDEGNMGTDGGAKQAEGSAAGGDRGQGRPVARGQ